MEITIGSARSSARGSNIDRGKAATLQAEVRDKSIDVISQKHRGYS